MTAQHLVLSILAEDRPGIVSDLANQIRELNGNWLESSLSQLRGHFAGIVHVQIDGENLDRLAAAVEQLSASGIEVRINRIADTPAPSSQEGVADLIIEVEANDRAGIVKEITNALSDKKVNVKHLETRRENAAMAGYDIFYAIMQAELPSSLSSSDLEGSLEALSDDLMVTIKPAE